MAVEVLCIWCGFGMPRSSFGEEGGDQELGELERLALFGHYGVKEG